LLVFALGAALAACDPGEEEGLDGAAGTGGGGGGGGTGGGGGRPPDGGGADMASSGTPYRWIAIFDGDRTPVCTGSGPGADIDSVDLIRGGTVIGVGLTGSAQWSMDQPGTTVSNCSMCGSGACPYSGMTAAPKAEGIQDGKVNEVGSDMGYIALNAGMLWLQVGSQTGGGTAQDIKSGDKLVVREIDQVYKAEGSAFPGCACAAEKYTVYLYGMKDQPGTRVQLRPSKYWAENMAMCGGSTTPGTGVMDGCGTTEFTVP
jgi:hypothetical protein